MGWETPSTAGGTDLSLAKSIPALVPNLQAFAGLDDIDAKIYALGLEKFMVMSRDVVQELGLSQSTAGDRLVALANRGFFLPTAAPPGGGGRKSGRLYKVVSPRQALSGKLQRVNEFMEQLQLIDEHLEVLADKQPRRDEIFRIAPDVLAPHFESQAKSAKATIKVASNDCSWIEDPDVRRILREAAAQGTKVFVSLRETSEPVEEFLNSIGAEIRRRPNETVTFALLDDEQLYIAHREGRLNTRYAAQYTANPDLVNKFVRLFDGAASSQGEGQ